MQRNASSYGVFSISSLSLKDMVCSLIQLMTKKEVQMENNIAIALKVRMIPA